MDDEDDFDYDTPTVQEVRERYVQNGDFIQFCLDLEWAIAGYGLKESDLGWRTVRSLKYGPRVSAIWDLTPLGGILRDLD